MTTAELRLECLKLGVLRAGAYDRRTPVEIAAEYFAWCTDIAAMPRALPALKELEEQGAVSGLNLGIAPLRKR